MLSLETESHTEKIAVIEIGGAREMMLAKAKTVNIDREKI